MNIRFTKFFFLLPLFFLSCHWADDPIEYTKYKPVLLDRQSLEKSIVLHQPDKILSPAKIYYKDNYIFISERFKGVHIIDNSDPTKPVNKGYIAVPGCVDMAIKNDIFYVDNATDLVAVDLGNIQNSELKITKRVRDAFPELAPPDGNTIPAKYERANRPDNTVIVGWK